MIYVFDTSDGVRFARADKETEAETIIQNHLLKEVRIVKKGKKEDVPVIEEKVVGQANLIEILPNWTDLCRLVRAMAKVYDGRVRFSKYD